MPTTERFLAWVATGGTIAGSGNRAHYTAGVIDAERLRQKWHLKAPLPLQLTTPYQIDSKEATPTHWRQLHQAVATYLSNPACAAVVITHGTDTLEESAALLALTLAVDRPIVFTGAMYPADDPASDGPANWQLATALACDPATQPGVYVAFAGHCYPALGVRKAATTALAPFIAATEAPLMNTSPSAKLPPDALSCPEKGMTAPSPLPLPFPDRWPTVALLSCTATDEPRWLSTAIDHGARAAVLLCAGHGSVPSAWTEAIATATAQGIAVVRASRCCLGPVLKHPVDAQLGTWPAGILSAAQARVALALITAAAPSSPRLLWDRIAQP